MKLKKFITTVLTTITTACISVCFSGCKDITLEIKILENSAKPPYYDILSEGYIAQETYRSYHEFEDYILGDFKKSNSNAYSYIQPYVEFEDDIDERIYGWSFEVYSENESDKNILIEHFKFYDEQLGGWVKEFYGDGEIPSGVVDYSVSLTFIFSTLETKPAGSEVLIEFGDYSSTIWNFDKYINLYIGENCIGTCYYQEGVNVPQQWFADYFSNKLKLVNV